MAFSGTQPAGVAAALPTTPPAVSCAALTQRRQIFARLLAARDAAIGSERASADAALARCRSRLTAAVAAARSRHNCDRAEAAVLARLYPAHTPPVARAAVARATLRSWARRLQRSARSQAPALTSLDEAAAALADAAKFAARQSSSQQRRDEAGRAASLVFEQPAAVTRRDSFFRARRPDTGADRRLARAAARAEADGARAASAAWSRAAGALYAAVNRAPFLARHVERTGETDLLRDAHERAKDADSLARFPDAAERDADATMAAVSSWRTALVRFLARCDDELLALSAAAAELTDGIRATRARLAEREFGPVDVATLPLCEVRLQDYAHVCDSHECKRPTFLGKGRTDTGVRRGKGGGAEAAVIFEGLTAMGVHPVAA